SVMHAGGPAAVRAGWLDGIADVINDTRTHGSRSDRGVTRPIVSFGLLLWLTDACVWPHGFDATPREPCGGSLRRSERAWGGRWACTGSGRRSAGTCRGSPPGPLGRSLFPDLAGSPCRSRTGCWGYRGCSDRIGVTSENRLGPDGGNWPREPRPRLGPPTPT